MTSNATLLHRSLNAVWHPCTQMKHYADTGDAPLPLIPIARGSGAWLYDFDGNRYLDAISSWWVNLFGHANPRINAALRAQMDTLEHVILAGCTHEPVVELSERLSALTGGALGHCFFASDGASATEIALKMSFHSWRNRGFDKKSDFLCLEGGYHGETVGALSVTDVPLFKEAYAPLVRASATVASPAAQRAGESPLDCARRAAESLERRLEAHHEAVAALIVEPLIQCANGMAMYDPEYLRLARELCDRYDVHLICDEIAVGCGRTGTFFAHEQANIRPDFLCLSKGISGGYLPLSIVMTTGRVFEAFYDDAITRGFLHSHSYTGNALACRAALATLDIFESDNVIENNRALSEHLARCIAPLAAHPAVANPRRRGMIAAFDVLTDDPGFSRKFYREALKREILLRPIGTTVYFMPPYIITPEECEFLATRAADALEAALRRN
ncbi:MAG: adenosylmethionine--8-amino-7-oxononanoate transaminase [Candidatus Accumulibacter sp.]|jgi:adenosylmethionine-8-amino-7-oxononanoate aminotransferase|nr:adenosylmethionine--8-amino-7-oxononanoate transaminase [Accumulibacter sp.]